MQVTVTDKCQGHGRCLALAPEVFDIEETGYGRVHLGESVPDSLAEQVRLAAMNCPEAAIRIRR